MTSDIIIIGCFHWFWRKKNINIKRIEWVVADHHNPEAWPSVSHRNNDGYAKWIIRVCGRSNRKIDNCPLWNTEGRRWTCYNQPVADQLPEKIEEGKPRVGQVVNSSLTWGEVFSFLPPFRLVIVALGIMLTSLYGWIRLALSLTNWTVYQSLGVLPGVWYLTISGLFSGCIYLAVAFLVLFTGKRYRRLSSFLLLAGVAGFWFDRAFASISAEARTSLLFTLISSAGFTIVAIGFLYWDKIFQQTGKQEK